MGAWELVVMAAGVGSRFGGLKQLEPVGPSGERLLDYSVYDAVRAGAGRVVVVLRREMEEEFHALLGRRWASLAEVAYAFQNLKDVPAGFAVPTGRSKPWGTGHAVLAARRAVTGPFAVINADDFYGAEGFALLAGFFSAPGSSEQGRHALVAYRLGNTLSDHGSVSRGVCRLDGEGRLAGIDERLGVRRREDGSIWAEGCAPPLPLDPNAPVSMNLWGFGADVLGHLEERFAAFLVQQGQDPAGEFYLPTAVTDLIAAGLATVEVLTTSSSWFGLTHREDTAAVRRHLAQLVEGGAYPPRLWSD
ncbi:MAG: NTP transferase domain-containing protein [Acidobacteriota bacterium]|jgi:hypothetical protein